MTDQTAPFDTPPTGRPEPVEAIPTRHPARWIAAAVITVILASLLVSLWNNPNLDRATIGEYLFADVTLRGVLVTLELTVIAMVIGVLGGIGIAVMRLSKNPVLVTLSLAYVWFFRGTPQLVQIIFWGFLGALYPQLSIGIPFTDIVFASGETSALISAFTAAILGLALCEVAYASEIVRAGILSVDRGQTEAAKALGMKPGLTMRRIVLPQAMRMIIPPMGNETITMLKTTSLVSVISGTDLLTNLQKVYSQTFEVIPLLAVATIWYLFLTSILTVGQYFLERRFSRSDSRQSSLPLSNLLPWRRAGRATS